MRLRQRSIGISLIGTNVSDIIPDVQAKKSGERNVNLLCFLTHTTAKTQDTGDWHWPPPAMSAIQSGKADDEQAELSSRAFPFRLRSETSVPGVTRTGGDHRRIR